MDFRSTEVDYPTRTKPHHMNNKLQRRCELHKITHTTYYYHQPLPGLLHCSFLLAWLSSVSEFLKHIDHTFSARLFYVSEAPKPFPCTPGLVVDYWSMRPPTWKMTNLCQFLDRDASTSIMYNSCRRVWKSPSSKSAQEPVPDTIGNIEFSTLGMFVMVDSSAKLFKVSKHFWSCIHVWRYTLSMFCGSAGLRGSIIASVNTNVMLHASSKNACSMRAMNLWIIWLVLQIEAGSGG